MSDRAIIEAIRKITGDHKRDNITYVNAEVISVSVDDRSCVCHAIDGHTEYQLPKVMLMAVSDDGLLLEPKVGSIVKILFSDNIEPCIIQYSEIDNVTIISNKKIKLNGDSYGGIGKTEEIAKKISNLETQVNNILNTLKTTTIPLAPSGTYPFAPLYATINAITPTTTQSDISNTEIVHGS